MDPERTDPHGSSGAEPPPSLVMVGNFDGVHRGHQWVLGRGLDLAEQRGLRPVVLTFHPHPSVVLGRGERPVLTPLERKVELLQRLSPRLRVVVEPFTRELAGVSPREFARDLLQAKLNARRVTVGQNFRFGRDRAGDAGALAELGAERSDHRRGRGRRRALAGPAARAERRGGAGRAARSPAGHPVRQPRAAR
jgi:riboflavin kinase/FMN adenylyltransferase